MTRPDDISEKLWEQAEILTDQFRHIEDDREFVARILQADRVARVEAIGLTAKQSQAFEFIRSYRDEHGVSPSYDEIATAVDLSHRTRARSVVQALAKRGLVSIRPHQSRSISILVPGAAA